MKKDLLRRLIVLSGLSLMCLFPFNKTWGISPDNYGNMEIESVTKEPIYFNVHIPSSSDIPYGMSDNLRLRLNEAITSNGLATDDRATRFILVPKIEITSSTTTPTIPPKNIISAKLHLYIGDGVSEMLFDSESFTLKGSGNSMEDAFAKALNRFNPKDQRLQNFIDRGRERAIDYYETLWPMLVKDAERAYANENYEDAFTILNSIPTICSGYEKALEKGIEFSMALRDKENAEILRNAKAIWSQSPDTSGAEGAMEYLNTINPLSSSAPEAARMCDEISKRLKTINDREWAHKVEQDLANNRLRLTKETNASAERQARIKAESERQKRIDAYNHEKTMARIDADARSREQEMTYRHEQLLASKALLGKYMECYAKKPVYVYTTHWCR